MESRAPYKFCPDDGHPLEGKPVEGRALAVCAQCGFVDYQNPKPAVAVLIVCDGRILLGRRGIEPAKGKWDIVGGFIEAGESAEEAVLREVLEETTLRIRVTEFLGSVTDVYGERMEPTLNLCFIAEIVEGTPNPGSDVEVLAWFSPDALPSSMAFEHQYGILDLGKRSLQKRNQQPSCG